MLKIFQTLRLGTNAPSLLVVIVIILLYRAFYYG